MRMHDQSTILNLHDGTKAWNHDGVPQDLFLNQP